MKPYILLFLLTLFVLPQSVQAAVTISEVAWMGSAASANHEWIELHNDAAEAVDLEGWVLTDSGTLSIALTGSVAANSYAVLERTSDDSAAGTALLVYTGALVNTGTTLTLRNAGGAVMDQLTGGENWSSIGGDNVSKDTAQYSGTKWVTAPGTPGRANASASSHPTGTQTGSSGQSQGSGGNLLRPAEKKTPKLELANVSLALEVDAPDVAYVGQRIPFFAIASGPNDVVLDSLQFAWNFGDIATGGGRRTSHRYEYAGEYVVTVHAAYGRHEQVARKAVTVLPVSLSITKDIDGNVQVNNDAPYEVVLDGFALSGSKTVVFPPLTMLLPRATITVGSKRVGAADGAHIVLRDAAGNVVASDAVEVEAEFFLEEPAVEFQIPESPNVLLPAAISMASDQSLIDFADAVLPVVAEAAPVPEPAVAVQESVIEVPLPPAAHQERSLRGLFALLVTATCCLYFGRTKTTSLF